MQQFLSLGFIGFLAVFDVVIACTKFFAQCSEQAIAPLLLSMGILGLAISFTLILLFLSQENSKLFKILIIALAIGFFVYLVAFVLANVWVFSTDSSKCDSLLFRAAFWTIIAIYAFAGLEVLAFCIFVDFPHQANFDFSFLTENENVDREGET